MKWIPLSETTPTFSGTYTLFCSENSILGFYDFHEDIPTNATHFIEIEIPPLPKSEKRKDPDWKFLSDAMDMWSKNKIDNEAIIVSIYRFLKEKYDK